MTYPAVILTRDPDTPIDTNRINFTRIHRGQVSVLDKETNNLYFERTLPIDLKYALTIITTNVVDMDEIVKEILFKYTSMYFITMQIPYESNRQIRFGITVDNSSGIQRKSSTSEYLAEGKLHQTIIPLKCEGCVLISYTPQKVKRFAYEKEISLKEYHHV